MKLSRLQLLTAALLGSFTATLSTTALSDGSTYANAADAPVAITRDEQNNIDVFREVSPSVVFVTNTAIRRRSLFSFNVMETPQGSGTGFVWDDSGLIVTNYHVVARASRILITLQSGDSYEAVTVGEAPEKDIAVLRIEAPREKLEPIALGDSQSLSVGRKVLAIGNPFGLDTTLTVGVVSALGREIKSLTNRTIKDVIQTDAAINPGNSGGPLLNSRGQLVGVNTAIYSPSGASAGIGFAIPVNTLKRIMPRLIKHGNLFRPVLGVETLSDYYAQRMGATTGVAILAVRPGYPASDAGLIGVREDRRGRIYLGDVIVGINGDPVTNGDSLLSLLEQYEPGEEVKVATLRDEKIRTISIQLQRPD